MTFYRRPKAVLFLCFFSFFSFWPIPSLWLDSQSLTWFPVFDLLHKLCKLRTTSTSAGRTIRKFARCDRSRHWEPNFANSLGDSNKDDLADQIKGDHPVRSSGSIFTDSYHLFHYKHDHADPNLWPWTFLDRVGDDTTSPRIWYAYSKILPWWERQM